MRTLRMTMLLSPVFALLALAACSAPDRITAPPSLRASQSPSDPTFIVALEAGDAAAFATEHGITPRFVYAYALKGFAARMSPQAADALERNPNVAYVELAQTRSLRVTQFNPPSWGLSNVRPGASRGRHPNGALGHAVSRSQFVDVAAVHPSSANTRNVSSANLSYSLLRESGVAVPTAFRRPTLRDHIGDVVNRRSDEQVRGIDARRVVAAVADELPNWNWPNGQFVSNAVGERTPSVAVEYPVPLIDRGASPQPALVNGSGLHVGPESRLPRLAALPTDNTAAFRRARAITALDARRKHPLAADFASIVTHTKSITTSTNIVQLNPPWGLDRIDQRTLPLDQLFSTPNDGAGTHAYIIDTGLRTSHVEFFGRVCDGADFTGEGIWDIHGHGTHTAGTVGGTTYGAAKQTCIHPVKIFDVTATASDDRVIAGMDWVAQHRVTPAAANMSYGGPYSQAINDATVGLAIAGVVPVTSAGNANWDACAYSPASSSFAITVAASDINDQKASFSNWGPCVSLYAPGVNILSAGIASDDASAYNSGTSMAAPHVTGAALIYLAQNPWTPPEQVKDALIAQATPDVIQGNPAGTPNRLLYIPGGTVTPPPPPPPPSTGIVAAFTASCVRLVCTFDASASHADAGIAHYDWSFGDGSFMEGDAIVTHTYTKPGGKTVRLTVFDNTGASASATQTVKPSKR